MALDGMILVPRKPQAPERPEKRFHEVVLAVAVSARGFAAACRTDGPAWRVICSFKVTTPYGPDRALAALFARAPGASSHPSRESVSASRQRRLPTNMCKAPLRGRCRFHFV